MVLFSGKYLNRKDKKLKIKFDQHQHHHFIITSTVKSNLMRRAKLELTLSIVVLVPVYSNVTPPYANTRGY